MRDEVSTPERAQDTAGGTVATDNPKPDIGTGRDRFIQRIGALTPLLTVLIAAVGAVVTICFQTVQAKMTSDEKEDAEWRAALDKVSADENSAEIGVFEVQTFAQNPKYKNEARSIEAAMLPILADKYEFDAAFDLLLARTNDSTGQNDIIVIARTESNHLRDLYEIARKQRKGAARSPTASLEDFVLHPEAYFTEDDQQDNLRRALVDTWKLDTVTNGLSKMWKPGNTNDLSPGEADLAGIIFLNRGFDGVDFSHATMDDVYFVGSCSTANANFGATKPAVDCHSSN